MYDLEMLEQMGFCNGIENYSRHLSQRASPASRRRRSSTTSRGLPPGHRRVAPDRAADRRDVRRRPRAQGDPGRARLPLPSALDNRPLRSTSGRARIGQTDLRLGHAGRLRARQAAGVVVEQIIRPTGLIDPEIEVRPVGTRSTTSRRDPRARRRGRARAGHHAHQAHGRGPHRVLPRARRQGALPALRHRHLERIEILRDLRPRRVRRAGRHQPAARGPRPARGVAGGHPRRRQGGLPALESAR
jgi:hypothetical protein